LLLRVNFYTLQKIELLFEILETRLENQLDEVARSVAVYAQRDWARVFNFVIWMLVYGKLVAWLFGA